MRCGIYSVPMQSAPLLSLIIVFYLFKIKMKRMECTYLYNYLTALFTGTCQFYRACDRWSRVNFTALLTGGHVNFTAFSTGCSLSIVLQVQLYTSITFRPCRLVVLPPASDLHNTGRDSPLLHCDRNSWKFHHRRPPAVTIVIQLNRTLNLMSHNIWRTTCKHRV